jgi:hypothetical protein
MQSQSSPVASRMHSPCFQIWTWTGAITGEQNGAVARKARGRIDPGSPAGLASSLFARAVRLGFELAVAGPDAMPE